MTRERILQPEDNKTRCINLGDCLVRGVAFTWPPGHIHRMSREGVGCVLRFKELVEFKVLEPLEGIHDSRFSYQKGGVVTKAICFSPATGCCTRATMKAAKKQHQPWLQLSQRH